jgi:proteasome lid subunit RPN8/RPN11
VIVEAVDLDPAVREDIYDHVFGNVEHEVGGVLLGRPPARNGPLGITASIPALEADNREASVTFTHESWAGIYATMEARHPGLGIVGWYHSHPGFGIFLSEHDLFIHRSFFSGMEQLAYVVDPRGGQEGFFGWRHGDVEKLTETATLRAPVGSGLPTAETPRMEWRATSSRVRTRALATALAGAMVGSVLGALLTAGRDDHVRTVLREPAPIVADQRVADLRAQIVSLQQRPGRSDAAPPARSHVVRAGENLSQLAKHFYGDERAVWLLAGANGIEDLDGLPAGVRITVPPRAVYARPRERSN